MKIKTKTHWQESFILFFEQASNFLFYLFALFIILIPILKALSDFFPSTDHPLWVIASIIVFVFILPMITGPFTEWTLSLLEKFRRGEILSVIFKPLKNIFSVLGVYGVLALEYKVIHGESDKTLFEVFFELLKAL